MWYRREGENFRRERPIAGQIGFVRATEHELEFYLAHNKWGVFSGLWTFPEVTPDYQETTIQAVVREAKEKTGVVVKKSDVEFLRRIVESTETDEYRRRLFYHGRPVPNYHRRDVYMIPAQNLDPLNRSTFEYDEMKWVSLESALESSISIAPKTLETMQVLSG